MTAEARATAVIAAAGVGERLAAGGPKALVAVAGRPLVAWSVAAMLACSRIERVVIAAPSGFEPEVRAAAGTDPRLTVIAGGPSRSASVALAVADLGCELVAVHDAARPLVDPAVIDDAVAALAADPDADGLVVAAPVADTIKRSSQNGAVTETLSRAGLWAVQTPQVFRTQALRRALDVSAATLAAASDDAGLLEAAGGRVLIHPSETPNPKVTTPADLTLAAALLTGRG